MLNSFFSGPALLGSLVVFAACAPRQTGPAGVPVGDAVVAAAELQRNTEPVGATQVTFSWSLDEAGSRLRGRGVARYEADRLRLDLFGPRGETLLAAALVGDEFRVPGTLAESLELPPAALLWASVGVVRPPAGARVASATTTANELIVRYSVAEQETIEYRAATGAGEAPTLQRVSWAGPRGVQETLTLTRDADGPIRTARYRDLAAYRELVLNAEASTRVESFPAAIWSPDVAAN